MDSFKLNIDSLFLYFKFTLVFSVLFLISLSVLAQPGTHPHEGSILKVGVAGSAPFVFQNKQELSGIAVEVWEAAASRADFDFRYVPYPAIHDALDALKKKEIDLVVGPLSITAERAAEMRFSQPYYQSSLSILSRAEKPSLWDRVKPFFSTQLLAAIGVFLVILAIVGTLTWIAERKESPEQFPHEPLRGIANGMWLAIVTMSTTGYGDRAPITFWGRIIAGSWMVISIIFATSMVAGIASTLTLTGMENTTISIIEQLNGKKAATVANSPAEDFIAEYPIKEIKAETLEQAIALLLEKEVDAVIYDRPQLLYYLTRNKNSGLFISKAEYSKQGYGFAFPLDIKLNRPVNIALLELSEERKIERILDFWLGKGEDVPMQ